MKTTKALLATATPSASDVRCAFDQPEEMQHVQAEITPETIAMLLSYRYELSYTVRFMEENDSVYLTDFPDPDQALRHALGVALKATRAANKIARGEWALRKLKAERRTAKKVAL